MHRRPRSARIRAGLIALTAIASQGCDTDTTGPEPQLPDASSTSPRTEETFACPGPAERLKVLVDASHGGGVWWYPQSGSFDPDQPHQGRALAQRLRQSGFEVDEAPRNGQVPVHLMGSYGMVVRVGNFGAYTASEVQAYARFAACDATLIVLGEFLREGGKDAVAEALGVTFVGSISGQVSEFTPHPLTDSVTAIEYIAGSTIASAGSGIELLAWVDGEPVMAAQETGRSRRFFLGDANGLQLLPQPFTDNLIAWMLSE